MALGVLRSQPGADHRARLGWVRPAVGFGAMATQALAVGRETAESTLLMFLEPTLGPGTMTQAFVAALAGTSDTAVADPLLSFSA
ncbi:MAG TPA: hypothetical protein VGS19_20570 [Streptosporangiaceae bacterium]|nr:hypothetical protein [Streptosporangiaceae bacterium]